MTEQHIELRGEQDVVDALDQVRRQADDLTEINRRVVSRLIPDVAARSPVRTGELAGSWSVGASSSRGEIRSSSGHAGPVESGVPARGIAPVGMVARTIAEHVDDITRGYEDDLAAAAARADLKVIR